MDLLKTAQAHALQEAMVEAQRALREAHDGYQSAFDDAIENADGAMVLRAKARVYAQALSASTNATMVWLSFLDAQMHPKAQAKGSD